MKLPINPLKLRQLTKHYLSLYAKQAVVIQEQKAQIADLTAKNVRLNKSLELAHFEIKRYQQIEDVVTLGIGFKKDILWEKKSQ